MSHNIIIYNKFNFKNNKKRSKCELKVNLITKKKRII